MWLWDVSGEAADTEGKRSILLELDKELSDC